MKIFPMLAEVKQSVFGIKGNTMPLGIKGIQGSEPNLQKYIDKVKEIAIQATLLHHRNHIYYLQINYRDDEGINCTDTITSRVHYFKYQDIDLSIDKFYSLIQIS